MVLSVSTGFEPDMTVVVVVKGLENAGQMVAFSLKSSNVVPGAPPASGAIRTRNVLLAP